MMLVKYRYNPFKTYGDTVDVTGKTFGEMISDGLPYSNFPNTRILRNGEVVPESEYAKKPEENDVIIVQYLPQDPVTLLITIGVILAISAIVTAAVAFNWFGVGDWLANKVAKWLGLDKEWEDPGQSQRLPSVRGGKNRMNSWGTPNIIFGTHYVVPHIAAKPYSETVGNDQYLRGLLTVGQGDLTISNVRIGETPISNFESVTWNILQPESSSTLYPNVVGAEEVGAKLNYNVWNSRTTDLETDEIIVDIEFPRGLFQINDDGKKKSLSCKYIIQYKKSSDSTWTTWIHRTETRTQMKTVRKSFRLSVTRDQYDVQIKRETADHDEAMKKTSDLYWTTLRSVKNEDPLSQNAVDQTTRIEYRIKATDQLNGVIDEINCDVTAKMPVYSGTGTGASEWSSIAETSNPASICLKFLRDDVLNGEAISDTDIDWEAFEQWYQFCETKGFYANGVHNTDRTLDELLKLISNAGRALIVEVDGKISVVIEQEQSTYAGHFNPRNSWGFSAERIYKDYPHALRINFVSAEAGWQQDEQIVYDDGYNQSTATDIKTIDMPFVTDADQVWKFGRFALAEDRLRPEKFVFNTDIENITCGRGDMVRLSHDALLVGLGYGRISEVDIESGSVVGVYVDELLTMEIGKNYGLVIRKVDQTLSKQIVTNEGSQSYVEFTNSFDEANAPERGDLFTFGEFGQETMDVIIQEIVAMEDLSAQFTVVPAAPEIYNADSGTIPDYSPNVTLPAELVLTPPDPVISSIRCDGTTLSLSSDGTLINNIRMAFHSQDSEQFDLDRYVIEYRLLPDEDLGETESEGVTEEVAADWEQFTVDAKASEVIIENVEDLQEYEIRVRLEANDGYTSDWVYETVTAYGKASPPSIVSSISVSVRGTEGIEIKWSRIEDKDYKYFILKVGSDWDTGTELFSGDSSSFLYEKTVAGTYTFRVKAVDTSGNEASDDTSVSLTVAAPSAVEDLIAQTVVGGVHIQWNKPLNYDYPIDYYEIRRGEDTDDWAASVHYAEADSTDITIQETDFDEHSYWIAAIDEAGNEGTPSSVNESVLKLPSGGTSMTILQPTIEEVSEFLGSLNIAVDSQYSYVGSYRNEIQASVDGSTWGKPVHSGTVGTSGTSTFYDGNVFTHADVEHDGTSDDPQPRTMYYRVRRVDTDASQTSDWSATETGTTRVIQDYDIAVDAIKAYHIFVENLQALSADMGTLTAGKIEAPTVPENFNIDLTNRTFKLGDTTGDKYIELDGAGDLIFKLITFKVSSVATNIRGELNISSFGDVDNLTQPLTLKTGGTNSNYAIINHPKEIRLQIADTDQLTLDSNGNVGIGTASPSTKLDVNGGLTVNGNILTVPQSAIDLSPDWYTIAANAGNRAIARFGLRDTDSGNHQSVVFYASHHFGHHSDLTILHSGRHSNTPFRYIRIKKGGVFDGALLQVYIDRPNNKVKAYLLGDNFQNSGWVLKDWVPDGTDPGTVNDFSALTNVAVSLDIDDVIDGGIVTSGNIVAGSTGKASDTILKVLSNDSHNAEIQLYGASQGTGRVYVGQDEDHGGGIEYNGDNSPSTTADYITLWRRSSGDDYWTARNKHNSSDWEFRGGVTVGGHILPETSPTIGSHTIAKGKYHTPSRGLYSGTMHFTSRGAYFIYATGAAAGLSGGFGGPYSGTTKTRIYNSTHSTDSRTWHYAIF